MKFSHKSRFEKSLICLYQYPFFSCRACALHSARPVSQVSRHTTPVSSEAYTTFANMWEMVSIKLKPSVVKGKALWIQYSGGCSDPATYHNVGTGVSADHDAAHHRVLYQRERDGHYKRKRT